ncbi:MAG: AAA domain-containing protein, partial [Burkholderiales bacterium]
MSANDGDPGRTPQKRLIALLDYIEQVEKLNRKPTFVVPTGYFCRYEEDLRGLPSVEFDCGGEGDEVWLRIQRLKEKDPPPPSEILTPWVVLNKSPDKVPQLHPEITLQAAEEDKPPPVTLHLEDAPDVQLAFEAYVRGAWTAWADYERPRRKTIACYNELFKLQQVMEAEGVETPIELVWGIGMALWEPVRSTHIRHPLITQAVEISLDPVSLALDVRPRDRLPTLEVDAYVALDNPGVPSVEAAWRAMLDKAETTISPFDESSFRMLLGVGAGYLDANGRYYPEVREDPEDRRLPKVGLELTLTDTWVLFARSRSSNFFLDDLVRLRSNLEQLESVPGGPAALVSELTTEVVERPTVLFRGLSHGGSAMPAGMKPLELYFPKPYNEEQVSIVEKLETSDGVVVQGPPGTGKTHTIANVICHYLANGKRVLVT